LDFDSDHFFSFILSIPNPTLFYLQVFEALNREKGGFYSKEKGEREGGRRWRTVASGKRQPRSRTPASKRPARLKKVNREKMWKLLTLGPSTVEPGVKKLELQVLSTPANGGW
jgi:hypothetical protein